MMDGRSKEDRRRRGQTWKGTRRGKEDAAGWLQLSTTHEERSGGGKQNPNHEIMGMPRLKKQKR